MNLQYFFSSLKSKLYFYAYVAPTARAAAQPTNCGADRGRGRGAGHGRGRDGAACGRGRGAGAGREDAVLMQMTGLSSRAMMTQMSPILCHCFPPCGFPGVHFHHSLLRNTMTRANEFF